MALLLKSYLSKNGSTLENWRKAALWATKKRFLGGENLLLCWTIRKPASRSLGRSSLQAVIDNLMTLGQALLPWFTVQKSINLDKPWSDDFCIVDDRQLLEYGLSSNSWKVIRAWKLKILASLTFNQPRLLAIAWPKCMVGFTVYDLKIWDITLYSVTFDTDKAGNTRADRFKGNKASPGIWIKCYLNKSEYYHKPTELS